MEKIIIPLLFVFIVAAIVFFLVRKMPFSSWSYRVPQLLKAKGVQENVQELENMRTDLGNIRRKRDEMREQLLEIEEQLESAQDELVETRERLQQTSNQLNNMRNILEGEQKRPRNSQNQQLDLTKARLAETKEQLEKILGGDLLMNKPWLKLATACVDLLNDLDKRSASFDHSRQELALYVCSSLELILERSGVDVITEETVFDETRHLAEPPRSRVAPGTEIAETLSPGFVVGSRVLRRAHVRLMEKNA